MDQDLEYFLIDRNFTLNSTTLATHECGSMETTIPTSVCELLAVCSLRDPLATNIITREA